MNFKNELEKSIPANMKLTEKEKEMIRYRVRQSPTSRFHMHSLFVSVLAIIIAVFLVLPSIQTKKQEENPTSQMNIYDKNQIPNPFTEEQKQQYYKQYLKIVDQAMKLKTGIEIGVQPIKEFKESEWVAPKEYEKMVQNMIHQHLATEREEIAEMSSSLKPAVTNINGETTKSTYLYFPDILRKIEVTAKFDTQYSSELDRQVFVSVDNVLTQLASSTGNTGKWKQTSVRTTLVDGGKKFSIQIEGIFTLNNLSFEKVFTIEFNCNKYGNIY
ncbi:hypothetical protein ACN6MY_20010 [Peribacillus sp. B-H-3]|uniref:hypothetical protein n=1 Tax=Peribacillus sp. B-H-3 TaxID=3400420 RepID=UPI003B023F76